MQASGIPSISVFQTAHSAILQAVSLVQPLTRDYPVAAPLLLELSDKLLTHWGRQDKRFWDNLQVRYRDSRESSKTIEFLIFDLKEIKVKYLAFYDKYSGLVGQSARRALPVEFSEFSAAIIGRIKIEEEYLFPLFSGFCGRGEAN